MKPLPLILAAGLIGLLGGVAYSHYLGEGRELAQVRTELFDNRQLQGKIEELQKASLSLPSIPQDGDGYQF